MKLQRVLNIKALWLIKNWSDQTQELVALSCIMTKMAVRADNSAREAEKSAGVCLDVSRYSCILTPTSEEQEQFVKGSVKG